MAINNIQVKKKALPIVALCFFFYTSTSYSYECNKNNSIIDSMEKGKGSFFSKKETIFFDYKIAKNLSEMSQGFKNICEEQALKLKILFTFNQAVKIVFQMNDVHIPIDVAFINDRFEITEIKKMEMVRNKLFVSEKRVKYALEVRENYFFEKNIKVGDKIILNLR